MAYEHFFLTIDITIGNAWLLYQIEHEKKYRNKKYLSQYDFKRYVSECWMAQNECTPNRRLRRHTGRSSPVPRSVRFDTKNHLPNAADGKTGRKMCAVCKASTNVYCTKCKVHLCMFSARNCFIPFHTKVPSYHTRVRWVNNNAHTDQESDAVDDVESQESDAAESQDNASTDYSETV